MDLPLRVTKQTFPIVNDAIGIAMRVGMLENIDTFEQFEAALDRLFEDARRLRARLKDQTIAFVFEEGPDGV